jgi:hypothetical protein
MIVIDDSARLDFAGAETFDCRLVLAAEQCNPLRLDEVDERLAREGFEYDPANPDLYRSTFVVPSLRVRALKLEAPTQIAHPSGRTQRVAAGWIAQRIADPSDVFLVPEQEFASHYTRRDP